MKQEPGRRQPGILGIQAGEDVNVDGRLYIPAPEQSDRTDLLDKVIWFDDLDLSPVFGWRNRRQRSAFGTLLGR